MKDFLTYRRILLLILLSLWILNLFFPIIDVKRGEGISFFDFFWDSIFLDKREISIFGRVFLGLPLGSLLLLSLLHRWNLKDKHSITVNHVKTASIFSFVVSALYSLLILFASLALRGTFEVLGEILKQLFNLKIPESGETPLFFYWFNIVVPALFLAFFIVYSKYYLPSVTIVKVKVNPGQFEPLRSDTKHEKDNRFEEEDFV